VQSTQIARELRAAIHRADVAAARCILAGHAKQLKQDVQTNWLNYFLNTEARRNNIAMMDLLFEFGAEIDSKDESVPDRILWGAACEGAIDAVRWLLDHGAKVNHVVQGVIRCAALAGASWNGNVEIVKLLVEHGADVNAVWKGNNALSFAMLYGKQDVESYLRSKGALEPWQLTGEKPSPPPVPSAVRFRTCAHYIVPQHGPECMQEAVRRCQRILVKYGIDPYRDRENLLWAPHAGHTIADVDDAFEALSGADKTGSREIVVSALQLLGKQYINRFVVS